MRGVSAAFPRGQEQRHPNTKAGFSVYDRIRKLRPLSYLQGAGACLFLDLGIV